MRGEPLLVKQLLQKARDSALLAVEFYNKPAVSFKSEGYITMMCIAWTSLFHAYFLKNGTKPYYRKKQSGSKKPRFEIVVEKLPDGKEIKEKRWWELKTCIEKYFKDDSSNPVRKNLEFFVPLRNMIVHRNLPELDDTIYGECQALLINFNNFIEAHFQNKYSIKNSLSFSLQLTGSPKNFLEVSKSELKKKNASEIVEFIKAYRSTLTNEQFDSAEYSFKAVLIKVKNHESRDAIALKVINEKDLTDEQKEKLKEVGVVLVKEKEKMVDGVPVNYKWTYKELQKNVKQNLIHISNKRFEKFKNYLRIKFKNNLAYERIHNPKSKNKNSTWFYDPKILEEFKKFCPPITSANRPLVNQIETLVDKILAAKKQNPAADTSQWGKEINQIVYKLYELNEEEIKIMDNS